MRLAGIKNLPFLFSHSLKSLLFPQGCIHCMCELEEPCKLLCASCLEQLEWLRPEGRCHRCFQPVDSLCPRCWHTPPPFDCFAACFEYEGAIQSVIGEFKYANRPYLAASLASFMLLQMQTLNWPICDILTFIPQTFLKSSLRGYNQSALLAKHLGHMLLRPSLPLLKKSGATFSQSRLNREQRLGSPLQFSCPHPAQIEKKRILLIDDVYTTGTTISSAAQALQHYQPASIYVLTVCT